MRRQHDAELCERIRVLEERVKELEARPTTYSPHWCYFGCPIHYGTGTPYPQWSWTTTGGSATSGAVTIGSTKSLT